MFRIFAFTCMLLTIAVGFSLPATAQQDNKQLIVFAAASLTDALNQHALNWSRKTGNPAPRLSFAASAVMARQIQAGAPADVFISANTHWVDSLSNAGVTEGALPVIAQNQLVFAGPTNTPSQTPPLNGGAFLAIIPSTQPIAMADPKTAPAGVYAQRYLENLGVWHKLQPRLAFSSNVRQALLLIERGGLQGFVYGSDVTKNSLVKTIFTVPDELSGAILYKAAKIKGAPPSASDFIHFLLAPENRKIWETAGFMPTVSK